MGSCYRAQSSVLCDDLEGWDVGVGGRREAQEGKNIGIPVADSCCHTAESNITLSSNYSNLKN